MQFHKTAIPVLALPRVLKRLIALVVDASLCVLTVWFAFFLRTGEWYLLWGTSFWSFFASLVIALPIFIAFGLYRAIFRYSGLPALKTVFIAVAIYGLIYACIFVAIGVDKVPRTVGIIQPILLLLAIGGSRVFARFWLGGLYRNQIKLSSLPRVIIYGAGNAGQQLATALANSNEMRVVGFLEDDVRLSGHILHGLNIYRPDDMADLVNSQNVSVVLLAMPSIDRYKRNLILDKMAMYKVAVRTLPSVTEMAQGRVNISDIRELDIDDLLGREAVKPNNILMGKSITGKIILVTGAGGSIGGELCRQIINLSPRKLLLLDQNEHALYQMHQELQTRNETHENHQTEIIPLLASVRDKEQIVKILATWKPHTVYHAAAYKHVPMVEHNLIEGIQNNIFGTLVVAKAAIENMVSDVVFISTDKAVRPTNMMGASKRLAEMLMQALADQSDKTRLSMVRFGNVLGSSGSVVPKFRQQIKDGGPITLTHKDITRYFMSIPEAAQLVIQAGSMAKGGDVFLLDMGDPIRIYDLAKRMIELSGLTLKNDDTPDGDIDINVIGLRPGEKLFEELLIGNNPEPTTHSRIMKAHEDYLPWAQLKGKLQMLQSAIQTNDVQSIVEQISGLVSGYKPSDKVVDWVYKYQNEKKASTRASIEFQKFGNDPAITKLFGK